VISFEVHVHTGAKVNRVGGLYAGALVVRVREPRSDFAGTIAVTQELARVFGVSHAEVSCLRGQMSQRKYIAIEGDDGQLQAVLNSLLGI